MLHFFRFCKHLFTFLFMILPLMIIGWFILPFILLFVSKDQIRLPQLFKWWDNVDNYIGRDDSVYKAVCQQGYWARYTWLAFRNPINYVGYMKFGLAWTGKEVFEVYDPKEDNIGDTSRAGFRYIEVWSPTKGMYYEYYLIYRYPGNPKKCCRYRIGWKIVNNKNPIGSISQWVFVLQLYKDFTGVII